MLTDGMNEKQLQAFKHFLKAYEHQYQLNKYAYDAYDDDLEFYHGYKHQNKYPLPYQQSFNKLMPRVYNVLARFMEHIYQGGTNGLVSVASRTAKDTDRAPRVAGLLNHQLSRLNDIDEHGHGYMHTFTWLFNALTFGKGITKLYWRKEERITPKRVRVPKPRFDQAGQVVGIDYEDFVIEQPSVIYDQPYAEVLHNKMFVPHPHYKSIQKMPFVFCVYSKSIDYLKEMADKGVFDKKAVANIGWRKARSGAYPGAGHSDSGEAFAKSLSIEGAYEEEFESDKCTPFVDIVEGYGRYIFPEDESPYEIGSGIKMKGKESDAIVHLGNYKTLLKLEKNQYGIKPFFQTSGYYDPELFWDKGIISVGKGIQEFIDMMGNTRFSNALMNVNQMLKVREDADIDPAALVWKPFGIVPVQEMEDVQVLATPDISGSNLFTEQETFFDGILSEMTGETPYNLGSTPPRQEFVGTVYSLQQVGQARAKLLLMTMDHQGFQPFLKHMMRLNVYHLPTETEVRLFSNGKDQFQPMLPTDLHFDYDFTIRYTSMEPALGKNARMQQLIQYAQMWQDSPYLQQHQFMKAILEMMDFHDTDRYVYPEEMIQQKQQQQQQQAVQAQMMGAQVQDNLAENAAKRELVRDLAKGILK